MSTALKIRKQQVLIVFQFVKKEIIKLKPIVPGLMKHQVRKNTKNVLLINISQLVSVLIQLVVMEIQKTVLQLSLMEWLYLFLQVLRSSLAMASNQNAQKLCLQSVQLLMVQMLKCARHMSILPQLAHHMVQLAQVNNCLMDLAPLNAFLAKSQMQHVKLLVLISLFALLEQLSSTASVPRQSLAHPRSPQAEQSPTPLATTSMSSSAMMQIPRSTTTAPTGIQTAYQRNGLARLAAMAVIQQEQLP